MRLAFFHPKFKSVGGAENLIASQAGYLRTAGHEICVVSHVADRARWQAAFPGIEMRHFEPLIWRELFLKRLSRYLRSLERAAEQLRERDAVIAHNFPSCALLGLAAVGGTRKVWYCNEPHRQLHLITANPATYERVQARGPSPESHAEQFYAEKLGAYATHQNTQSLRDFDLHATGQVEIICANSEFTRDNVHRTYGRSDALVVYPIVRFPAQGRPRSGIDRSRGLQVLAHARLDSVKNVDHVLRGFALYRARAPGAQLHVVGIGDQAAMLHALARQLQLGEAVRFHGFLPQAELERVYDACDVFALTPLDEPFGMVFPEAAARGLLLLGPSHAGPNEILDGGRLGWTCDAFEPESLAEALARVAATSDSELDARRARADAACRSRYGEATIGPQLARIVSGTPGRALDSTRPA